MGNRIIKFRGKRADNGEWAYGEVDCGVFSGNSFIEGIIIPETVGQYTGLKDKNGVEIYEGDILVEKDADVWEKFTKADGSEWSRFTGKREDKKYTVFFDEKKAQFTTEACWLWSLTKSAKIIGNIHDNPERTED